MNITIRRSIAAFALTSSVLIAAGCSENASTAEPVGSAAAPSDAEAAAAEEASVSEPDSDLVTAEAFIDAFYSFDADRLAPMLASAPESAPRLLYYQGWAEGGNYVVLERTPCAKDETGVVNCPVKVRDDPVQALGTGFDVTDTFHLTFDDGVLVKVETSSNDQEIYGQARAWVEANMPEVMSGPCANRNTPEGTPAECARAMTAGYAAFAASPDFPGVPPLPTEE